MSVPRADCLLCAEPAVQSVIYAYLRLGNGFVHETSRLVPAKGVICSGCQLDLHQAITLIEELCLYW